MANIPLSEFGVAWFKDILRQMNTWFRNQLTTGIDSLSTELFGTPLPNGSGIDLIFSAPNSSDEPWVSIYANIVGGEVMVFALVCLFITVQGRHFLRIFDVGGSKLDRQTRTNAWPGAVLIVGWYWVAVLTLYLIHGLTIGLIPNITQVSSNLLKLLPITGVNPLMTFILVGTGAISLTALKTMYFLREVLLYVYLYGMPIGIAFAFSNLPVISQIAARFCRQFIPLAILPLPAAVLFRGYALLFGGSPIVTPSEALFQYVTVISLPVLGVYLTWKTFRYGAPLAAGAISRTGQVATTAGVVAGIAATGGTGAAATAARYGSRAGVAHAAIQQVGGENSSTTRNGPSTTTGQDNVSTDTAADGGVPAYRRAEHDPGYY
ncbi:hypothetical protein [Halobaculum lipolyticum]|uniref:Type IV secretion system protein TrbL n=1 Tax=Halobaculum lipolyticum TaxID=3032001 RepID=A0ABD5WB47_9EURY|nr:hypothetical protein [Halobaculum sp. DT31]